MKYKIWTVNDIQEVLDNVADKSEISVDGIPIIISGRMTRVKGCCCYRIKDKKLVTTKFKFAKQLVNGTYPEHIVKEVIIHEYAHHYINTKTNKSQKHNKLFKETCRMLGISDETYFQYGEIYEQKVVTYKYKVSCTKCGTIYNRKVLKGGPEEYIKKYVCGNCRGKLKVEEY